MTPVIDAVEDHRRTFDGLKQPFPVLAPQALYRLPGRLVNAIDPYNEGDRVATLVQTLAGVGNLIGAGQHARVQFDHHPGRLYVAVVGETSKARKGLSWSTPQHLLSKVDPAWASKRILSGLSSGEGVIYHVRNASEHLPAEPGRRGARERTLDSDPGEPDKRLLVIEPEFAVILKRMHGETNTLSAILRDAWDSGNLGTLTRNSALRATGAQVSIIAHTTEPELCHYLTETDRANGFANRFMFFSVRRSKCLPAGASPPDEVLAPFIEEFAEVAKFAKDVGEICRDDEANALWFDVYPKLSEGKPGLLGAIVARAEAHVLRLSVLYAVLDRSAVITADHLKAALAVWDYAEASARRIFGDRVGLPEADAILGALRCRKQMTRTEISALFGRNVSAARIEAALGVLEAAGLLRRAWMPEGSNPSGRPAEIWEIVE